MSVHIVVNGEPKDIAEGLSVAGLIEQLELAGRRIAVEVNGDIVPRSAHATHNLNAHDRVEIVHAIGGG